mmetsp:Transcript_17921/g.51916  ORF Transcript_17921/g.51916 Transcript_17921/m.51916 type:complete len:204 (-) Transcript_17921:268-879(-)
MPAPACAVASLPRGQCRRAPPAEAFPAACAQARPCPGTPPETRGRQGLNGGGGSSPHISPHLPDESSGRRGRQEAGEREPAGRLREGRVQVQRSVQRSVLRRRRSPILAARGACSTAALLRPARLFPLLPTAGLSTRSLPRGGFAPLCGTARLRAAALSFAFASSPSACSTASSASSTCASASFAAESAVPMSSTSAATISCK